MEFSQEIIDILNKDEFANKVMKEFDEGVKENGLSDEDNNKCREALLYMLISRNKEALNILAKAVFDLAMSEERKIIYKPIQFQYWFFKPLN